MISKEDAKKVAKLARLGISEKEAEEFKEELSAVLKYFEMINEANVSEVKPTFHSAEEFLDKQARKDEAAPEKSEVVEEIIASAPDKKERYIKVKAIL